MNPEQRAGGREAYTSIRFRVDAIDAGMSVPALYDELHERGFAPIVLVVGPGGAGKSALVHALDDLCTAEELGRLVKTASTGVAAAPFGGATVLSLFSIRSRKTKTDDDGVDEDVRESHEWHEHALQKHRSKWLQECGISNDDTAAIIWDEISFNDCRTIGLADYSARAVTGEWNVPFGGVPAVFLGTTTRSAHPAGDRGTSSSSRKRSAQPLRQPQERCRRRPSHPRECEARLSDEDHARRHRHGAHERDARHP